MWFFLFTLVWAFIFVSTASPLLDIHPWRYFVVIGMMAFSPFVYTILRNL